jgi:hypothetical protein
MGVMAGKKRDKPNTQDLQGFKYFKVLAGLLESLHTAGCQRDRAHNRILHMDQYMMLLIMYMFNPVCSSLRALQEASELKKVQRVLEVPRSSLGSLSEAARVFDSDLLIDIIGQLVDKLQPIRHDAALNDFDQVLTLVDGSWLRAVPKMTWALFQDDSHKSVKLHMHLELLKGVPVAAAITDANTSESHMLSRSLQGDRLYVLDRGYFDYALYNAVIAVGSSFVCRARDNVVLREIVEERELSGDALSTGIVRDTVAMIGHCKGKNNLGQPVRVVEIECTVHRKPSGKTGRGGPVAGETIKIITDRLDLPPEVIGLIYRHRWQVEIFFRFFKHVLGCRHLLSHCDNGIELETYAAIIACLLIALWTGRKPTLSTYRILNWYFSGWADEEELLAHISKLKMQDVCEKTC